jgi:hypothetical protein
MAEGRVSVGVWWEPRTWERARSAYVWDLDHNPSAPAGFIEWLHWVLEAHVARGPAGRAGLAITTRATIGADQGLSRNHPLRVETHAAVDQAIIADRQAGRMLSRSAWIHEAVTAAIADAERRAGTLPQIPAGVRLPNRPNKPSQG